MDSNVLGIVSAMAGDYQPVSEKTRRAFKMPPVRPGTPTKKKGRETFRKSKGDGPQIKGWPPKKKSK